MKKILCSFVLVLGLAFIAQLATGEVVAQSVREDIQGGVNSAAGGSGGDPNATLNNTIAGIVNILTFIVGAVAVLMIIYGGYLFTISAGDPGKIATAKRSIIYAIIGIVIAAAAQVITRFVISEI